MLYAPAADEMQNNDTSGKYLTPFGFVNTAPDLQAAGSERGSVKEFVATQNNSAQKTPTNLTIIST